MQDGGTLELGGGGISNAAIHVAAGGTLRLTEAAPEAEIINGSFEVYNPPTITKSYRYQPTGTGWSFSSNCGIQANDSGFSSHPDYHTTNGTITAFVKGGRSSVTSTYRTTAPTAWPSNRPRATVTTAGRATWR